MRTKEEYYEDTLKNRALLESQEVLDCSCPYSRCEWHGKCRECVALHRYHAEHLRPYAPDHGSGPSSRNPAHDLRDAGRFEDHGP